MNRLRRRTEWRIDQPDPVEGLGKPVNRGRARDELTIDGAAYPGYAGALDAVSALRDAADAGKSLTLVDGEGTIYGSWMIASIDETQGPEFTPTGIPRRIEFSLTLKADPEDETVSL
jgi:phage protein U